MADDPIKHVVVLMLENRSLDHIVTIHTTDPADPAAPPIIGVGSIELI